jgi:hypothetical protein
VVHERGDFEGGPAVCRLDPDLSPRDEPLRASSWDIGIELHPEGERADGDQVSPAARSRTTRAISTEMSSSFRRECLRIL